MRLTVKNVEYILHFEYGKYDGRRTTTCRIHIMPCPAPTASTCLATPCGFGQTHCSVEDEFVKAKGRTIAIARAMKHFKLSREIRTLLWSEYFKRTGQIAFIVDIS